MNIERDDIRKILRDFVDSLVTEDYIDSNGLLAEIVEEAIDDFMEEHEYDFVDLEEDK